MAAVFVAENSELNASPSANPTKAESKKEVPVLIFSVFIAGLCSIIYELLIATTSSYFLGDSITQFSLTIGIYMAAMGVGSYCSRLISDEKLLGQFILAEIVLALLGGASVPILYIVFSTTEYYQFYSLLLTFVLGCLIGLEIPLLSRLMSGYYQLKMNISNIMSIDYFGALIATLLFPFVLLPFMGVFRSSVAFGLMNLTIAMATLWCFAPTIGLKKARILQFYWIFTGLILAVLFIFSESFIQRWSNQLYTDRIIYQQQTPYQNIVLTRYKQDTRLFLNGNLQFSAMDEYRYHEALVHVPMHYLPRPGKVLLLGAGDGLATRELLKYPSIESITIVDLDPAITQLAKTNPNLLALNQSSLLDPKVKLVHQDAFAFLDRDTGNFYDFIIIDLPDPKSTALARFYSKEFYQLVKRHLTHQGVMVTQATSPIYARKAFWSIRNSLTAAGYQQVLPYHINVPSFGEWGFIIATKHAQAPSSLPKEWLKEQQQMNHRFVSHDNWQHYFHFDKDIAAIDVKVSSLDQPEVMKYYLQGWKYWN
ncbi:MAG: spermidine synthase [Phenylobacterium sp.]